MSPIRNVVVVAAVVAIAIAACSSTGSDRPTSADSSKESTVPSTGAPPTESASPTTDPLEPTTTESSITEPFTTELASTVPATTESPTTVPPTPPAATRYLDPTFPQVDVQRDVVYGTASMPDGSGGVVELWLDLYTPRGDTESKRPVFIYSHGGGFVGGDKSEGFEWATLMAERGYVAASIDYRLGPSGVTFPFDEQELAQVSRARSDLQAAVRWFKANATMLGIDPDRVGVGGFSAGAIMSAVAAVRSNSDESLPPVATGSNPEFSSAVCGAVSIAGALNPAFVDAGDAGVIFHHGTLDDTVPIAFAMAARDALLDAGLPVEWHEYPDEDHGFSTAAQAIIETTSVQWLYDHVATAPYPCSPAVAANVPIP